MSYWMGRKNLTKSGLQETPFTYEDTGRIKGEEWEKYTKKTRIIGTCSSYMNKRQSRFEDKKCFCRQIRHSAMIKGSIKEESVIILNMIGKLDIYLIIIGDFYTCHLAIDKPSEKKNQGNKCREDLNIIINYLNLIDTYI